MKIVYVRSAWEKLQPVNWDLRQQTPIRLRHDTGGEDGPRRRPAYGFLLPPYGMLWARAN